MADADRMRAALHDSDPIAMRLALRIGQALSLTVTRRQAVAGVGCMIQAATRHERHSHPKGYAPLAADTRFPAGGVVGQVYQKPGQSILRKAVGDNQPDEFVAASRQCPEEFLVLLFAKRCVRTRLALLS